MIYDSLHESSVISIIRLSVCPFNVPSIVSFLSKKILLEVYSPRQLLIAGVDYHTFGIPVTDRALVWMSSPFLLRKKLPGNN